MLTNSRMTAIRIFMVLAAGMFLVSSPAMAQDVANGSATATVVTPLTVTATSPLAFGTVYQGVPKSVSKNTADAAVFDITGQANADLLLYLSLPEFLATSTGDDRMVIAFADNTLDIDTAGVAFTARRHHIKAESVADCQTQRGDPYRQALDARGVVRVRTGHIARRTPIREGIREAPGAGAIVVVPELCAGARPEVVGP